MVAEPRRPRSPGSADERGTLVTISRRTMLVGSLALAGGAILDGCAPDSGSVGGKTPIRIGHQSAVAMRAVFMEATGYAARTMGVPVSFSLMASGPATVQAFAQEQLDIAYL